MTKQQEDYRNASTKSRSWLWERMVNGEVTAGYERALRGANVTARHEAVLWN